MIPIVFKEANALLAADQDEYEPLPAYRHRDGHGMVTCAFRLSAAEIAEIMHSRTIWLTQLTFNNQFQPVLMSSQKPEGMK